MIKEHIESRIQTWQMLQQPAIMERFVIRNGGEEKRGVPFTEERGKKHMCFMNATHYAMANYLPYVEGFAMRDGIDFPFHHAWCLDEEEIVDPTLIDPEKFTYIGVEIPEDDLRAQTKKNGVYGVLDYGMINFNYMFERDPELKTIVEEIIGHSF